MKKLIASLSLLALPCLASAGAACHEGYNCKGRVLYRIPGDTAIAEDCLNAGGNSISAPRKNLCYNIEPGHAPTPPNKPCVNSGTMCLESQCECCSGVTVLIGNRC